jgi:hypothetical protein
MLSGGSRKGPGNLQYFSTEKPRQRGCARNEKEGFLGWGNSGVLRIEAYLLLVMTTEFYGSRDLASTTSSISPLIDHPLYLRGGLISHSSSIKFLRETYYFIPKFAKYCRSSKNATESHLNPNVITLTGETNNCGSEQL